MKVKIKLIILIISLFSGLFFNNQVSAKGKYFIVTAYYSPLPGQIKYHTGNYYSEIKLNGKGTHGASGKAVFEGMLAGPKSYKFGTKILFEGLGIGEIADRGGAIVKAGGRHKYDRIDIWMGYGYAGLIRAEKWGVQTIYGEFIDNSSNVSIDFSTLNNGYNKNHIINTRKEKSVFNLNFKPKDKSIKIRELQVILNRLKYKVKVTGIYDKETTKTIIQFQKDNNLIKNISSYGAGYFGPKTGKELEKKYLKYKEFIAEDYEKENITKNNTKLNPKKQNLKKEKKEETIKKLTKKEKMIILINNLNSFKIGDKGEKVVQLQKILKTLGFYHNKITGYFGNITKASLIKYQINKNIIKSKKSYGAGYLGTKTKEQIKKDIIPNIK